MHTAPLGDGEAFYTEVYLRNPVSAALPPKSLYYWSPRDPQRTQAMALGDWRFCHHSGALFVFRSGAEFLFWIWGSETAVRTDLACIIADGIFSLEHYGGAAFVTHCDMATSFYTLYLVPLFSRESADELPPATLPYKGAPLVGARELYRGRRQAWLSGPVVSPTSAPLVWPSVLEWYALETH